MTTPTGAPSSSVSSKTAIRSRFRSMAGIRDSGQSREWLPMRASISDRRADTPFTSDNTKGSGETTKPSNSSSAGWSLTSAS